MPIRFKGSARPRRVKSPDPLNMPTIRENIASRQRTEVDYFDINNEMPRISPPWQTVDTYFQIPSRPSSSNGPDGWDIANGNMGIVDWGTNTVHFYLDDGNGGWTETSTLSLTNTQLSALRFDTVYDRVIIGRGRQGNNEGRIMSYDYNFTTGVIDTGSGVQGDNSTGKDFSYDGRSLAIVDDLVISGAPGWWASSSARRGGLMNLRDRVQGTILRNMTKVIDYTLVGAGTTTSTSSVNGNLIQNEDYFLGQSMEVDQGRVVSVAGGSDASQTLLDNGYVAVFDYDGTTFELVQKIDNPSLAIAGQGYWMRGCAALNGRLCLVYNNGGPESGYDPNGLSIIEMQWDGSQYVYQGWYDVNIIDGWTAAQIRGFTHFRMVNDNEIIFSSTGLNNGKLYRITR